MTMIKTGISSPSDTTTEDGNVNVVDSEEEGGGNLLPMVGGFDWGKYDMVKNRWNRLIESTKDKHWEEYEKKHGRNRRTASAEEKKELESNAEKIAKASLAPEQEQMVEEVFKFYRNHWGFPFPLKTLDTAKMTGNEEVDKGLREAIEANYVEDLERYRALVRRLRDFNSKELLVGYDTEAEEMEGSLFADHQLNDVTKLSRELEWNALGMGSATAFMPHLHKCPVKGMTSPYDGFWGTGATEEERRKNEKLLRKAILLALRFDSGAWPSSIRYGLRSIGGIQSVGNFKPTVAKFLWEWYAPENGIVYDYSCGWGGRLTGARSSKKNLTYVGVDPSVETFNCLMNLDGFLCDTYGPPSEKGTVSTLPSGHREYRSSNVRITEMGSEDFCPPDLHGKVDFAFSSPPYFDLEQYGDNSTTQSHVKFPNEHLWLHSFIKQTAANIFKMLKPGSWVGLNLADFRDTKITDEAAKVYESVGFKYVPEENYYMRISVRTGNRSIDKLAGKKHKTESIFMFQKPA
jgi:hypothetical protein